MDERPIIFIDAEEHDMFKQALTELALSHPVVVFANGQTALDYLTTSPDVPFFIISEINMPSTSGLELRQHIDQNPGLRKKCIPFIFMPNPLVDYLVEEAYELTIQGLFEKKQTFTA